MCGMFHSRRHVAPFFIALAIAVLAPADVAAQSPPPPKPPVPPVPPVPTIPTLPTVPTVPPVPEVPRDPGKLADVVTPLSARMLVSARPSRARGLPATFRLSGWLRPPMRLDRVSGFFQNTLGIDLGVCSGPVTIGFRSGGRRIAGRRASVTQNCMFNSSITIRSRGRLGPAGKVRATARFAGNALLGPARHSIRLATG
jgi:hypothetical protein